MWSGAVVVPDVLGDGSLKVTSGEHEEWSRQSCRTVRTQRSAKALAYAVNYTRS